MTDAVTRAREVVELLERGDAAAVAERLSARVRRYVDLGWSLDGYLRDEWSGALADLAGSPRRIVDEAEVSPTMARLAVEGERGRAWMVIRFDEAGGLDGFGVSQRVFEGIGNIVIACPGERRDELAGFYGALLGADRWRVPRLVFDEGRGYQPPRWPDPDHPQQVHLDVLVRDVDAAGAVVAERGAALLQDNGDHRIYADPIGHPLCLYRDAGVDADAPGVLGRVVIDCFSPRSLAPFYETLLRMPRRVEDAPERVVIAAEDGSLPTLAFQHVVPYVAPRWPDPAFPAQVHFDLKFDDREAAERLAERLGAIRLPPQGGSCPVYADPAGHPFCLCMHGE